MFRPTDCFPATALKMPVPEFMKTCGTQDFFTQCRVSILQNQPSVKDFFDCFTALFDIITSTITNDNIPLPKVANKLPPVRAPIKYPIMQHPATLIA